MRRNLLILISTLLTVTPSAVAQSLFSADGLGVPVSAVDARARALGGIGSGLPGWNFSLTNPAEAVGTPFRGITAAYQSQSGTAEWGEASDDIAATRFPLLRVVYPFRSGLVATIGYGAFMDQNWGASDHRDIVIGSDTVAVRDAVDSSGGLARVQFGIAYPLARTLAIGLAGGLYTGRHNQSVTREFERLDQDQAQGYLDVDTELRWRQRGPFATAGLRWDPSSSFRLAGALTWSGTLNARADEIDGQVIRPESYKVSLPWQATAGMSALLAPQLTAVAGARWEGWSSARNIYPGADDSWQLGGGLEWEGIQASGRSVPLRLGYRYSQYPMAFRGERPTERATAFGIGVPFALTDVGPRALVDAALERGSRDAAGDSLSERFWQFTLSLSLFGP